MKDKRIVLADSDSCTGCSVCADICPVGCILMVNADGLFAYPHIDRNRCITCGRCMQICPSINAVRHNDFKQLFFAAWSQSPKEKEASTSGGIGSALASHAIEHGYAVCGVKFDSEWEVVHSLAKTHEEISLFRGSKYVQSKMTGIYRAIVACMKSGNKVLYIGTPCQVEAVKRFVPECLLDKLTTCEIICHGVNSPKVWADFVKSLQETNNARLLSYKFRSKSHGWQTSSGSPNLRVAYVFDNGKTVDIPGWKNQFHYWFGQHYILRPSCSHCKYRREQRRADITIGDFWGIQKVLANADTFSGVSVAIASSAKGLRLLRNVKGVELEAVDEDMAKSVLRGFVECKEESAQHMEIEKIRRFEEEYLSKGYRAMARKYPHHTKVSMFIYKVKIKLGIK